MRNDFSESMSKLTDEELIKIVKVDRNDYEASAVEAAEKEIDRRVIDTFKIEEVETLLTTKHTEQEILDASKVPALTRLLHFVIDTIAFLVLALILSYIVGLFFKTTYQVTMQISAYSSLFISFFAYYIFMEHKFQKTIGKFITNTKVVTKDGQRAELGNIVTRTIFRLIPLDRLSYLILRNGFHDYLSDTIVIKYKQ